MNIPRRQMLAGSLATGMLAGGSIAAASEHMLVIDTHVHCFAGTSSSAFPYHPQAPYRPVAPTPPELLLTRMDEAGVDRACVVQPEPYQDDHRYLEHCLQIGDGRLKGTCLFCFAGNLTTDSSRTCKSKLWKHCGTSSSCLCQNDCRHLKQHRCEICGGLQPT